MSKIVVNEIEKYDGSNLTITTGTDVLINSDLTVQGEIIGTVSATSALADGVTATTQATSDNSTKVATTAYVKSVVTAEDLDIAGTTGTGSVDLDSQTLTIAGTANEIETSASGQTITIGLPSTIIANVTGNVSGNLTGTVLTAAQANITSVGTLSSLNVGGNVTVSGGGVLDFSLGTTASTTIGMNSRAYMEIERADLDGKIKFFTTTAGAGFLGERMRIDENGNVGIGTSSPVQPLHVAAAQRPYIHLTSNSTGNLATDGTSIGFTDQNGELEIRNRENQAISFKTNNTEKVRIEANGNVGIGTSSPDTLLNLSANVEPVLRLEASDTTIEVGQSLGKLSWFSNDASSGGVGERAFISCVAKNAGTQYNLSFGTGSSADAVEHMNINFNGNVGIGTSSPATKLDVVGNAKVSGNLTVDTNTLFVDAANNRVGIGTSSPVTNLDVQDSIPNIRVRATGAGESASISIHGLGSNGTSAAETEITAIAEGAASASSMAFTTRDGSGNRLERMRITSSGNVGIGTSSPAEKLEVNGVLRVSPSTPPGLQLLRNSNVTNNASTGFIYFGGKDTVDYAISASIDSVAEGTWSSTSHPTRLSFTTTATASASAVERMRITSGGNVGIGTSSPADKVHIEGNNSKLKITNTNTTATGYHGIIFESLDTAGFTTQSLGQIDFVTSAGATGLSARIKGEMSNTNGAGSLVFSAGAAGAAAERMRIDSSGNVGIGTSSPAEKLDVVGNAKVSGNLTVDTNTLFVDASGNNVGIGTSSPSHKLYVNGNIFAASGGNTLGAGGSIKFGFGLGSQYSEMSEIKGILQNVVGLETQGGISFLTRPSGAVGQVMTERMRITSSGNVGIGTSSPAVKLDVVGQVRASTGILFGADTAAANALDDYEEGTFSAALYELGGGTVVTHSGASYTKIGALVHVEVQFGGGTTGGAGELRMNLPFAVATNGSAGTPTFSATNGGAIAHFNIDGTDYLNFVDTIGAIAVGSRIIGSDWGASSRYYFSFTYSTI